MADKQPQLTIIDDPAVREIYANKLIGAMFDGGAISITMGMSRFVPEKTDEARKEGSLPSVHVTARLSVSPAGAVELANALNLMLKTLSQASAARQPEQTSH